MPKQRTTLRVDEEAQRRDLRSDELERIWARVKPLPEKEALELAYEELHEMRREKRAACGP